MNKKEAYKIVYEDLINPDGCNLFRGIYDAKNGKESYMHGISLVIEYIAMNIDEETYDNFNKMFIDNLIKSKEKYERLNN